MENKISFRLRGRYALFTDPVTRTGGEKCTYQIPTYEAIKGVLKSIYWKPTLVWRPDRLRVIKPIRTESKGVKPVNWTGGNSLAIYTFLRDVEYEVEAHFEWNEHQPDLAKDRIDGKHHSIALRMLERGGRQDIFLGTRDCQGYVEPCAFGESGDGVYDEIAEIPFGFMFHSFNYPDETGRAQLEGNFWNAVMRKGVIEFPRPNDKEQITTNIIRPMTAKRFGLEESLKPVEKEEAEL